MTEWGVVSVIIALAGLIVIFVKVTLSYANAVGELKTSIATLNTGIKRLTEDISELSEKSSKRREDIYCKISTNEKQLNNHETRITVLERKSE